MTLKNNSPETITLTQESGNSYIADYGNKKSGFNSNFNILFTVESRFIKFRVTPKCGGCTTVKQTKISDKEYRVNISYKSTLLGRILKTVDISWSTPEEPNGTGAIKLRGKII